MEQAPGASSSICSVVCSIPKRSCRSSSSRRRTRSRSQSARDDDVGGERAEARGHGPDVQVVHRAHPLLGADRRPSGVDVDARRRRLHQHVERLLDQPPGGEQDQHRDHEADDRVDDRRAAGEDEGAGDDDAERAERVGGGVAQHPLEVDVLALAPGQDEGRGDVAGEAEERRARARRAPSISGGSPRRPIAAKAIASATATRSSPLTSAARTSERW